MNEPAFVVIDGDRELYVGDGISGGRAWFTVFRKPSGSKARVKSAALPCRNNRLDAETDLLIWARKRGLPIEWFAPRDEALAVASVGDHELER